MNNLQRNLNHYYKQIKKSLTCKRSVKNDIVSNLKTSVDCYVVCHPECSYEDIVFHFGTPKSIAKSYLECTPTNELEQKIKIRNIIIFAVILTLLIALLIYLVIICIEVCRFENGADGYEIITIEDGCNISTSDN